MGSKICIHKLHKNQCVVCAKDRKHFCKICDSVWVRNSPYKPLCFSCHCYLHPDEDIPRRYKLKQHYIYDILKSEYKDQFVYDKPINEGCSKKRPDFLFDRLTHTVIVEIDENQHTGYSCENKRTMSLFEDLGNRPLVMIRFNPDKYKNDNWDDEKGCFSFNDKNNIIVNKQEFELRMKQLLTTLEYHLNTIPTKELTGINLFFDTFLS